MFEFSTTSRSPEHSVQFKLWGVTFGSYRFIDLLSRFFQRFFGEHSGPFFVTFHRELEAVRGFNFFMRTLSGENPGTPPVISRCKKGTRSGDLRGKPQTQNQRPPFFRFEVVFFIIPTRISPFSFFFERDRLWSFSFNSSA